jgi:hypothetical protein
LRSGDRDVAEDTALVVLHRPVAAGDPLGLLDDPVKPFGGGIGVGLREGDQDGRPPVWTVWASLVVSDITASIAAS